MPPTAPGVATPSRHWTVPVGALELAFIFWWLFWAIPAAAHLYFRNRAIGWQEIGAGLAITAGWVAATASLRRFRTAFCVAGYAVLGMSALLEIGALSTTRSDFYSGFVEVILQTNIREAREFLTASSISPAFPIFAAMLLLPLPVLLQLRRAPSITKSPEHVVAWGFGILVVPVLCCAALRCGSPYTSYDHLQVLRAFATGIADVARERWSVPSRLNGVTVAAAQPDLLVVIVGESMARRHMGLYGYPRPTTPKLSAMAGQTVVFTDVVSSRGYTSASLREALHLPGIGDDARRPTIFQALDAAGFDTWWISNQTPFGVTGDPLVGLTRAVHHKIWLDKQITPDRRKWDQQAPWDESLLPALDGALADVRRRAVFVHLMGCHADYRNRYPLGMEAFTGSLRPIPEPWANLVNQYDTCVRNNDMVVSRVFERVQAAEGASATVYFSDHGEEVYDYRDRLGHDDAAPSKYMVEIPFLVRLSDRFQAQRPELARQLASWRYRSFSLADFSTSLADLSGIRFPGWTAQRSLFAAEFRAVPRRVGEHWYDTLPDGPRVTKEAAR